MSIMENKMCAKTLESNIQVGRNLYNIYTEYIYVFYRIF